MAARILDRLECELGSNHAEFLAFHDELRASESSVPVACILQGYREAIELIESQKLQRCWGEFIVIKLNDRIKEIESSTESHARQSGERITPAELEHLIEWHDNCAKFSVQSDNFVGEEHHQARAAKLRKVDDLLCDIGARSAPSTTAHSGLTPPFSAGDEPWKILDAAGRWLDIAEVLAVMNASAPSAIARTEAEKKRDG